MVSVELRREEHLIAHAPIPVRRRTNPFAPVMTDLISTSVSFERILVVCDSLLP